jgi:hypothetical protein
MGMLLILFTETVRPLDYENNCKFYYELKMLITARSTVLREKLVVAYLV